MQKAKLWWIVLHFLWPPLNQNLKLNIYCFWIQTKQQPLFCFIKISWKEIYDYVKEFIIYNQKCLRHFIFSGPHRRKLLAHRPELGQYFSNKLTFLELYKVLYLEKLGFTGRKICKGIFNLSTKVFFSLLWRV